MTQGHEHSYQRYPRLKRLVKNPAYNAVVLFLVMFSIAMILVEVFFPPQKAQLGTIQQINDLITVLFITELYLNWLISATSRQFLKNHWLEILAVLPLLRIFRLGRLAFLFRLLRLFSLGGFLQQRLKIVTQGLQSKVAEYGLLCGFLVFMIIFGAVGLAQFEVGVDASLQSPVDAFWKALFSLLSGEYADYPDSIGGKIVLLCLLFFEVSFFAILTGTISAVMIEKFKESGMQKIKNASDCRDHVVICGFSPKTAVLIKEFSVDKAYCGRDIILVSESAEIDSLKDMGIKTDLLQILPEDFTKIETLQRAGVSTANLAVILSEPGKNRSTHDVDARTILAALTIEKIHSGIHTCAEIYHREYLDHLKMGGVDDIVIQGEVSGKLLARIGISRGILPFFEDILSNESGNTMTFLPPPADVCGKTFRQALEYFSNEDQNIPVGIRKKDGELIINPGQITIEAADELLIISQAVLV
ncbi:hypothetical protein HOF92_13420 [bacterium]|jgi:voltage-gated potassium channel|nr:hypothetical protein [bacterium]